TGMAAFASHFVVGAMRKGLTLAEMELAHIFGRLDACGAKIVRDLGTGNVQVYVDLFWIHLAYYHGGVTELETCLRPSQRTDLILEAFHRIDHGKKHGDMESCWHGNIQILRYEQEVLSQRY